MSCETVWPITIKTVALSWSPGLQTFFVAFAMLWTYPIQKSSHSARRKYFSKTGQDEGVKKFGKLSRKATTLYLILPARASNFNHGFYNALDLLSPKIKTLSQC